VAKALEPTSGLRGARLNQQVFALGIGHVRVGYFRASASITASSTATAALAIRWHTRG
jgi:hypothetical protein